MKKSILILVALIGVLNLSFGVFAQAIKKPRIMVVPSSALLEKLNLLQNTTDMGEEISVESYSKAFRDDGVKAVVQKFSEMMTERGFDLTSLESALRKVRGKGLSVHFDIRIDLNYRIKKSGPEKSLYIGFSGIDEYSGKQIAAASGESAPSVGGSLESLLEEAVLDKIDQFNNQLMTYFEKMSVKGRESRLSVISESLSLDEEFGGKSCGGR